MGKKSRIRRVISLKLRRNKSNLFYIYGRLILFMVNQPALARFALFLIVFTLLITPGSATSTILSEGEFPEYRTIRPWSMSGIYR